MHTPFPYFGETLSLLTAIVWALAVVLFKKSGETVHPLALNLFKNTFASLLFIPTMLIFKETLFRPVPAMDYILLILSGFIGIGIGDSLFFKSLNLLGAGLSAIVESLYSPFIIALSMLWLGERLTVLQIIGAIMVIAAVLTTIQVRKNRQLERKHLLRGILYGVIATAAMAVGIVMIKPLLNRSPLLWATEVRLLGAAVTLIVITIIHPQRRKIISSLSSKKSWIYMLSGSFLGAYLAMFIWLAGMKYANVSIASALNQTSTLFIFIFASIMLHEAITARKVTALILAVFGAAIVFLG